MAISERIFTTIENWQAAWKDRLRGWMVSWLSVGIEVFFDVLGKAASPKLKPIIDRMEATGEVPPELQPLLDELKTPSGEVAAMFANSAGGAMIGGSIGKVIDAFINPIAYQIAKLTKNVILTEGQYVALWLRGYLSDEELTEYMQYMGKTDFSIEGLKNLAEIRLDPMTVVTAWRRDKDKYEELFNDLRHQGWTEDRIEALKFVTLFYPGAAEAIRWTRREAFEEDAAARYKLDEEFDRLDLSFFEKIGVDIDVLKKNWRATWEHASFMQMVELLHRGLLSENLTLPSEPVGYDQWAARDAEGQQVMYEWYRLVEVTPIWRDLITESMWNVPTRVDVRRWWDMRTIDEQELISIYHRQGYHGKDLENYVLWTKVYVAFPDLLARWTNGWITENDVRNELVALGMPSDRVDEMIQGKKKAVEAKQVEEGKDLTKSEIYKGAKAGYITKDEAIDLIMDLNYNYAQAEYLYDINVGALEGSPENYAEFKDITTKYKIAIGKGGKPMPEELKKAAAEVVKLTKEVEDLERSIKEEKATLVDEEIIPEETTKRLEELQTARNRAIAELEHAKLEYDRFVAEWRHGE